MSDTEKHPGHDASIPISGRFEDGAHLLVVRVYYEDTDFSGIVYHANYLKYLERGRTDQLRLAGVAQSALHAEGGGLAFAVRRMTIDWARPARMDDILTVETRTLAVKGASIEIAQRILRGAEVLLGASVQVAAIRDGRPARIPEALRARLGG
ncbi:tol-pal system-associated acyl-CoA thioesterase [Salinarimonas chemoclinalis]|uniref:tol-pal system-associated acyl-CoA thioesterase n=1 Tax=Salinarimonas chemoclinalis TaxID=3241599 RepID=UPI003559111F